MSVYNITLLYHFTNQKMLIVISFTKHEKSLKKTYIYVYVYIYNICLL